MHVLLVAVSCFSFYYCLRKAMRTCCFLMDLNSDMVLCSSWIQQLKFGFYLLFKKEKKRKFFYMPTIKLLSLICRQKNYILSMPLSTNFNLFHAIVDGISIVLANLHVKMTCLPILLVGYKIPFMP